MAQFVNYNKRDCTLPPGCKDLIDVLRPSRERTESGVARAISWPSAIREHRFDTAGLAQIGRYVEMLLQSRAKLFTLMVTTPDDEFKAVLYRSESESTTAIIPLAKDARTELGLRAFFDQQGIRPLVDCKLPDVGSGYTDRCLVYPFPLEAARATSLTAELFRDVYGLSHEAGLDFRYYEVGAASAS